MISMIPLTPKYAVDPEFDQDQQKGSSGLLSFAMPLRVSSNGASNGSHDVDFVYVPSLTVGDASSTNKIAGWNYLEERNLWFLQHLNKPNVRIVYVTSMPVAPCIVDYYLNLLSVSNNALSINDAKKRLSMVTCYDPSEGPLCNKMLMRPLLMNRIKNDLISSPERVKMFSHCQTIAEDNIAEELGIKVPQRNNPSSTYWGTKVGSRVVFKECDVPHCLGVYDSLESVDAIVQSIISLREHHPDLQEVMVKLNEGLSGYGNAIWTLPPGSADATVLKHSLITDLVPCSGDSPEAFLSLVPRIGAIVEEYAVYKNLRSPSAQGFIDSDGSTKVVSTHEQNVNNIGIYNGCTFPANQEYRVAIQKHCLACGQFLAKQGIRNSDYGIDFISWQDGQTGEWKVRAIEINLRACGTTHSMMWLKFVAQGGHVTPEGEFVDRHGRARSYFCTDEFKHPSLKSLTPDDLLDLVKTNPLLQYHDGSTTGTIFYMIDVLPMHGKVGILTIHDTPAKATEHCDKVKGFLLSKVQSSVNDEISSVSSSNSD